MSVSTATTANELTIVNPPNLYDPSPNGYSTAVIVPGGAKVAYISGQGGQDGTGALSPDFAAQVKQAYAIYAPPLMGSVPSRIGSPSSRFSWSITICPSLKC